MQGWGNSDDTVIYGFYNDNCDGSRCHPTAINPKEIDTVELNGVVIFEK